jgi:hypothetical protein
MLRRAVSLSVMAGALFLGACDSSTDANGMARVRVQLTDAPSDYLESAEVTIGRVELVPLDGSRVLVTNGGDTYDLLELRNGVTAELGMAEVEPGMYSEMRVFVTDARVTLKEGYTFTDGSTTQVVKVPSGAQSGIKIKLAYADAQSGSGVEFRPGETILVVDFDVSQNFVMQGNAETPAGIKGFIFTPVLRAVVRDVAGSIAGTVTAPEGVAVEGRQVQVKPKGAPEDAVPATTLVAADGTWKVHFLAPGIYEVTVVAPEGHVANTVEVTLGEAEHRTGVALQITVAT